MGQRGSNAAGLHQWDEEGNMILLRGGDPQFFGVRTQLERVFHQREENKGKQCFFFLFLCLVEAAGVAGTIFLLNGS